MRKMKERELRAGGRVEREKERQTTCPFIDIFTFEKPLRADPH